MTHVMVWRGAGQEDGVTGFWHHGVRLSDGSVVHYAGMGGVKTLSDAVVLRTGMEEFGSAQASRRVHEVEHEDAVALHVAEERALSMVGRARYDLFADNCETFARWCVLGRAASRQAQGAVLGVGAALFSMACGGGLGGAALIAIATHKMWDRAGNRSRHRASPSKDSLPTGLRDTHQ